MQQTIAPIVLEPHEYLIITLSYIIITLTKTPIIQLVTYLLL